MSLLFEEFFEKVFRIGKGNFTLSIIIKIIFFIAVIGVLFLLVYSLISENYWIIYIIVGGLIIAEIAHYIRKSREKIMNKKAEFKKKRRKKFLKNEKTKNKYLLSFNKPKNKQLLKEDSKNKNLLKK